MAWYWKKRANCTAIRLAVSSLTLFLIGCAVQKHEEVIAGVMVPIPGGMSRARSESVGLAFPGFEGGQVTYQGRLSPDEIVSFYRKELPARGWRPNATLISRGGALAYSKKDRSLIILISPAKGSTTMSILVGSLG